MKHMTIWQRLNTALLFLILLLLAGVGLVLWMEEARFTAAQHSDALSDAKDRICYDIVLLSETARSLAIDPRNKNIDKAKHDLEADLLAHLERMQTSAGDRPELLRALNQLRDFVSGPLGAFHNRVLETAQTDVPEAIGFFDKNFIPVRDQRERVFREVSQQIQIIKHKEAQDAQTIAIVGLSAIFVILAASVLVGRIQSTAVTEPLNRLVATLERMRSGDFTERLGVDRKDEFGVIGDGLNRLADDLSQLVGQVQRSGIQVNSTATEIAATAREQQTTAHEIAATTAEIGATSKEISATSKELVRTMNEVNHVAEQTAGLAGSGQTSIVRMESTMRQIMDASGSITSKLAVLNEKTANINSVVTTITKVADQTNLLSLNAAIEAEKAGEYGLGFAVVAMEIRRLADQTAVATYDIEKMVKEMQSAVAAGVMGMDKFSEEVRRGVDEIRHVSTHLAQIIHQVQTLTPRFQTVNEGMHAQATGAQQISETLTQLSEAAQQTADSLRQSNLAIEQLNGAARGLQTSVARFKLTA
jgi:methyl-accepting chemotaxis protein WspA